MTGISSLIYTRLIGCLAALSMAPLVTSAASFQGLGDLAGGTTNSTAFGISADGSTVVGSSPDAMGREMPFVWTADRGLVGLLDPADDMQGVAMGVNGDGSIVIGDRDEVLSPGMDTLFQWTPEGGVDDSPFTSINEFAPVNNLDVSYDGSQATGLALTSSGTFEAYRWTRDGGVSSIGKLPGGTSLSIGAAISGDGSVVVGVSDWTGGPSQAFRWTETQGIQGLGDLAGSDDFSLALGIASDGLTIVGQGTSDAGKEAFRWNGAYGMLGLGDLPGGIFESAAYDASADGSTIVGFSSAAPADFLPDGIRAFIWDESHGMRDLKMVLVGLGLDLTDWTLNAARAVSDDGRTIVGYGINPMGQQEAFIAFVPEPSTTVLVMLGLSGLALRRSPLHS